MGVADVAVDPVADVLAAGLSGYEKPDPARHLRLAGSGYVARERFAAQAAAGVPIDALGSGP